jgi:hypothetical protein
MQLQKFYGRTSSSKPLNNLKWLRLIRHKCYIHPSWSFFISLFYLFLKSTLYVPEFWPIIISKTHHLCYKIEILEVIFKRSYNGTIFTSRNVYPISHGKHTRLLVKMDEMMVQVTQGCRKFKAPFGIGESKTYEQEKMRQLRSHVSWIPTRQKLQENFERDENMT